MSAAVKAAAEPTEAEMTSAILDTARIFHWRVAHFRAARTKYGWRTAVEGDGAGFPDLVMVHPGAGLVWWIELKMKGRTASPEQQAWGDDLRAAGANWQVVRGKAGLDALKLAMAGAQRAVVR